MSVRYSTHKYKNKRNKCSISGIEQIYKKINLKYLQSCLAVGKIGGWGRQIGGWVGELIDRNVYCWGTIGNQALRWLRCDWSSQVLVIGLSIGYRLKIKFVSLIWCSVFVLDAEGLKGLKNSFVSGYQLQFPSPTEFQLSLINFKSCTTCCPNTVRICLCMNGSSTTYVIDINI